eukprot:SAG11_NODE_26648_length_342_cov_1.440329_1_plen_79_part_01
MICAVARSASEGGSSDRLQQSLAGAQKYSDVSWRELYAAGSRVGAEAVRQARQRSSALYKYSAQQCALQVLYARASSGA